MGVGVAVFIDGTYEHDISSHHHFPIESLREGERGTNNAAEWLGCIEAFKALKTIKEYLELDLKSIEIIIQSDSEIITRQYNGEYVISEKNPYFHNYLREAKALAQELDLEDLKIIHMKREFNKEADKLSKLTEEEKQTHWL